MSPSVSKFATVPSFVRSVAAQIQPVDSVGSKAAQGAFWNILFSLLNKLVALGAQFVLAWFLSPADIGLAGMALAVISVVSVAANTIPTILLIQHEGDFEESASEIFWFSLAAALITTLILVLLAPLAENFFKDPRIFPIILILALTVPLTALPTIYASQLYRALRFQALAQIRFGEGLIRNLGAVFFAALGFGAYSLVWPQPAGAIYTVINCRRLTGRIPLRRPRPRLWLALVTPAGWLILLAIVNSLQMNGIIFVTGIMHDPTVVGLYSWGFMLSSQAIYLLGTNLQSVFFPVLSRLNHDIDQQRRAFKRACQILTLAIGPLCALQIVLARPVIELFFQPRWLPAAPVVQWLSVGMITQPFSILGTALLLARGQFRLIALLTASLVLLLLAGSWLGALMGREMEIARCTGLILFFSNIAIGGAACRELQCRTLVFFQELFPPVFALLPLIITGIFLGLLAKPFPAIVSIPSITAVLLTLYGLGIWLFAPHLARELIAKIPWSSQR